MTSDLLTLINAQKTEMKTYFTEIQATITHDVGFKYNLEILRDLIKDTFTLNGGFEKAIYFTGIGKNDTIAKKSANMFRSLNFNAHHISPVDAMHGDMGLLNHQDILIPISKSGNTSELIHFLKYVKEFRTLHIYGIQVGPKNSEFDDHCDYNFHLPAVKEIDKWNLVPTTSNIGTQLFLDMIAVHCSNLCDLQKKDFIQSHPGGAIGNS